ncbi:MAG: biopolymer transporter ExbD [Candidatus Kapaibacterium sp.]|nr:biopolymer transporter ExbD [Bacteroidota bacterium]
MGATGISGAPRQRKLRGKTGSRRRQRRRIGFRMDMTPLVDVAFLLLTFFMLTSNLITQQAMELTVVRDGKSAVKHVIHSMIIRDDGSVFSQIDNSTPQKIVVENIPQLIKNMAKEFDAVTVVKSSEELSVEAFTNVVDKVYNSYTMIKTQNEVIAERPKISIAKLTSDDVQLIKGL